ncbi:MAG: hypothetical protein RMX97_12510 [Nostoc sp. DedQUE11]|nr:hypothetical protein [Nostoc sp. DedQUE11]
MNQLIPLLILDWEFGIIFQSDRSLIIKAMPTTGYAYALNTKVSPQENHLIL